MQFRVQMTRNHLLPVLRRENEMDVNLARDCGIRTKERVPALRWSATWMKRHLGRSQPRACSFLATPWAESIGPLGRQTQPRPELAHQSVEDKTADKHTNLLTIHTVRRLHALSMNQHVLNSFHSSVAAFSLDLVPATPDNPHQLTVIDGDDKEALARYSSTKEAIRTQKTGFPPWDSLPAAIAASEFSDASRWNSAPVRFST